MFIVILLELNTDELQVEIVVTGDSFNEARTRISGELHHFRVVATGVFGDPVGDLGNGFPVIRPVRLVEISEGLPEVDAADAGGGVRDADGRLAGEQYGGRLGA